MRQTLKQNQILILTLSQRRFLRPKDLKRHFRRQNLIYYLKQKDLRKHCLMQSQI